MGWQRRWKSACTIVWTDEVDKIAVNRSLWAGAMTHRRPGQDGHHELVVPECREKAN